MPARFEVLLFAALIVLAGFAAYANSFHGDFVLDDLVAIQGNPTIRQLLPLHDVLFPARDVVGEGNTVEGRPLLNLSFALNYVMGGLDVRGYHAVNLAIHLLAALLLFGIVRRTLLRPAFHQHAGHAASWLALAVALIWAVHPLQTESVTYVVQRAESLMGLFYLLTMYLAIRSFESSATFLWRAGAVISCVLGMATKEVMATAPWLVLLYDVVFVAGSLRVAWRERWRFYACLMILGWATLAALLLAAGGSNLGNMKALAEQLSGHEGALKRGHEIHWLEYFRMQLWAVARYVRLCFWPSPLVLYYGKDMAKSFWSVLPSALFVALLLAGAIASWRRRRWIGFAAAWFFLILAPTSSVVPLSGQTVAEHRMYLPLAAVISLVVIGSFLLWQRLVKPADTPPGNQRGKPLPMAGFVILSVLLLALGGLTIARNAVYRTDLSIWRDTVKKWPTNPVAHNNLAEVLLQKGALEEAKTHCEAALKLDPDYAEAQNNLGAAQLHLGDPREAAVHFQNAIEIKPDYPAAYNNLG
ncbi:MAG TPA: tetratricopeptide repeat protein, partial [Verrucomicrobiaceae bacterium]